jgi:Hemerythrin HHE cation binding domain
MTQVHDLGTDAIELLQRDHDEIRRLLSQLAAGPIAAGGDDPRGSAVEQLVISASKHEAIEEQYFWPVIRRRVHDGARLADEAVSQELQVKHVLDLLDGLDAAEGEFELLLRQLASVCRAHPHLPPDPEVQRLVGRIAGATDRIRDALAGRSGI